MSITALYLSGNSFSAAGDLSAQLAPGVRVRANCGTDGIVYGTVATVSASTVLTTVTMTMDDDLLTANLTGISHGNDVPLSLCNHASQHAAEGRDPLATATTGAAGVVELATDSEAQAMTSEERALVPANIPALIADEAAAVAGLSNTTLMTPLRTAQALAGQVDTALSGLLTYTSPGAGSVPRSIAAKLGDTVSVKDFGATGDGETDDTDAIQAAIDYAAANQRRLKVVAGTYNVTDALVTKSNLCMEWDNGAWIKPSAWPSGGVGAALCNVTPGTNDGREQENITLVNPQFDGENLPTDLVSNCNGIAFASLVTNVQILGGTIRNFLPSPSAGGFGGKAVAFDTGCRQCTAIGTHAENCHIGFWTQGRSGDGAHGLSLGSPNITFIGCHAENCEAAYGGAGVETAVNADPTGEPSVQLVLVDGLTFHNCGHAPWRNVSGGDRQKSGIFVLAEAQNVTIRNFLGYNDATYPETSPGYPDSNSDLVGYGLTGPVGALVWGWGRNILVSGQFHGACDNLIRIQRARAIGDDCSPTGIAQNCYRFNIDGLRHYGTAGYLVALDANAGLRVANGELTGTWKNIFLDSITGIIDASASAHTGIVTSVTDSNTGTTISGTWASIYSSTYANNSFSSPRANDFAHNRTLGATTLVSDRFLGRSFSIADDAAASFTLPSIHGIVVVSCVSSLKRAVVEYRTAGVGAQCTILATPSGSGIVATTGTLSGTTGSDGALTVSAHTDGKFYVENRLGATLAVTTTPLG